MGCRFSCFGQSSCPQTLSDQEGTKQDNNRKQSSCSVLSLLMLVCMWKNEAKERELLQEKEQQQQNKAKELTLEDWLIASPGLQKMNGTSSCGEYHVFKYHSSKRVYPSFVEENTNSSSSSSSSKARRSLKAGEEVDGTEDIIEVSLSMNRSGKSKKRVSFRLPEEADIFIFHSSPPEKESQ
ncbi:hypothetical protein HRI_004706500 [Hibiscus trionum]|uniref:Uncharacterized protein n=1 Tax=Hibiscus trionum TaxID=183268 RepID=A0A9W7MMD6_HIBTR|nr:hypothetical protein HRI_004706500 [Hibiscus trionum]